MHKIKIAYVFLLFLTFIFAFLVGGPMPYFLLYVAILSFLIPLLHILISFISIKAELNIKNTSIYAGDTVGLDYILINKNAFTVPMLEVFIDIDKNIKEKTIIFRRLSLNPLEKISLKQDIDFKRRGFYESIDFKINIADIYSLFKIKKKIKNNVNLFVYPNIVTLHSFKIYSDKTFGNVLVKDSIFQDRTSISSIKEYIEGDAINRIHWKISAKRGTPMVKDFENISNVNVNIFIDNNKSLFKNDINNRIEDKIVETSLAIVNYLLTLDIDISLNTLSKKEYIEVSNKRKDQLKSYLELFAKFKSDGVNSVLNLLEEKIHSFTQNSIVILVSPILDRKMGETAIKLKMKNIIPIFIIVGDKGNNNYNIDFHIKKRLNEENVDLYFIDYSSNIKEVLEIKYG